MAHQKDKHYWTQLRAALTAGQWSSAFPAKAPNATLLSWSELFRKFNKHCKGFSDIVEVASQTHALALLLGANSKDEDQAVNEVQPYGSLSLGYECMLPEERIEEASKGYEVLKTLQSSNFDSLKFALAYYAYALGRPSECLSHLADIPDLSNVPSHVPIAASTRSNTLTVPESTSGSMTPSSIQTTTAGSVVSVDSSSSIADINDGKSWATIETIRSICLKGMAHEKLDPTELNTPFQIYMSSLPLLSTIESEIPSAAESPHPHLHATSTPPSGSTKLDFTSFTRFRELWRWVERLLWRAIILAAKRTSSAGHEHKSAEEDPLWTLLNHYRACTKHWPPTFRAAHRSTVGVIYLRALVLRARSDCSSSVVKLHSLDPEKPPAWLSTARSVIQEYRAILSVSTRFPKAGQRNVRVEEFVDLCVAVWEASGAVGDYAGWVIDILWWATRLTFNSHRIFRHMTRLFYVAGDAGLARRTLRLYVQVVGKAHEAGVGDVDTDRHWVETLVQGARMLCRGGWVGEGEVGDVHAFREASGLIEKAKARLDKDDKELVASVELAEGVCSFVLAHKEHDPHTRPGRLSHSLSLFRQSVDTLPTPAGHYHLALALARSDLEAAIASATLAVEGAPREIRCWHLLGLLLVAAEQWKAAKGVLEHGAQIGESGSPEEDEGREDDQEEEEAATPTGHDEGVHARDFVQEEETSNTNGHAVPSLPNGTSDNPSIANYSDLLDKDGAAIPLATGLLLPAQDRPASSRHEFFEHALQLRMTQVALAEYIDGPERAGDKWVEVFGWIAEKKGAVTGGETQQTASVDASRRSGETMPPSELPLDTDTIVAPTETQTNLPISQSAPPPITITPASPAEHETSRFSLDTATTHDHNGGSSTNGFFPAQPSGNGSGNEEKRSSLDRDSKSTPGKKVQQMLKNRVHKGQARINTISKKIGHGVPWNVNGAAHLRRTTSAPDFRSELHHSQYQASSIHSRRRLGSIIRQRNHLTPPPDSPPPPPPPLPPQQQKTTKSSARSARENRLLSDLWLMSAATFRRLGKVEQAKGAIQEAEVKDENNPGVWVQLGLYHMAHGHTQHAIDAFHKALFISLDDVPATIHLCRLYLSLSSSTAPSSSHTSSSHSRSRASNQDNIDLAAGMLDHLTLGSGWDVPEAWYFLAKAYGIQGRKERERECLAFALGLAERRGVREVGAALGWCL